MRRFVWLGLALLLPGCSGFPTFFGDTHTFLVQPGQPLGDSENLRRVRGEADRPPLLKPEPGNVWPGPVKPEPTLADLERDSNGGVAPIANGPSMSSVPPLEANPGAPARRLRGPRGSSTPPGNTQPALSNGPAEFVRPAPATAHRGPPPPNAHIYQTPGGPLYGVPTGGIDTLTAPNGTSGGIAVPNGNGTTTIIGPSGSVTSVPTPR